MTKGFFGQRMRRPFDRGFLELTWMIFRVCMKTIFILLAVLWLVGTIAWCFTACDLAVQAPHQLLSALLSALVVGLAAVSYMTLFLAVPVSAFCAGLALLVTLLTRVSDFIFPGSPGAVRWTESRFRPPAPDPRIEVIETRVSSEEAICPVCAAPIQADPVSCAQCEAPHHKECWEYVGSCSRFGCGSRALRS